MPPVALHTITADPGINPRAAGLNLDHVAEMKATLAADGNAELPDVVAYRDGDTLWLSEGFHRYASYDAAGRVLIPCEVREGDRNAAKLNAATSNATHGLKRTNDDKRLAVRFVFEACPEWTDRQVAEHCGVAHPLVSEVRAIIAAENVEDSSTSALDENVEESSTLKKGRKGSEKKRKKVNHAKAAAQLLLKHHNRTDESLAQELGCGTRIVAIARKALQDKGRIPKPEKPAEVDPCDLFVGRVNQFCALLDKAKVTAKELAADPFGKHIHTESVVAQIEAARKALHQSRPTEPCRCVTDKPKPECKACFGLGKCPAARVLKGVR